MFWLKPGHFEYYVVTFWFLLNLYQAGFFDSAHQGKGVAASFLQSGMEGHASRWAPSPLASGRRPEQEALCPATQASTGALPGGWRAERWAHLFATSHTASSATTPGGTRRVSLAFAHPGVVGIQLSANGLAWVEWLLSKRFLSYGGPFPSPLAEKFLLGFYKKICTHWHLSIKFYLEAKQSPRAHSQVFVGPRVPRLPFIVSCLLCTDVQWLFSAEWIGRALLLSQKWEPQLSFLCLLKLRLQKVVSA